MARAVALARRGWYTTAPNPRVGCVLVRDGERVGEGWHRRAGEAHAEVAALTAAGERARGATAYVTLVPCCHAGRTPPCTSALIEAGIARVIYASEDPNPQVGAHSAEVLGEAGIELGGPLLGAAADRLNPGFFMRMREGRPRVTLKIAASLDGATAMEDGESRWITGEAARADVQRLRAESGAVLTGIGTVLADDPALTVRDDSLYAGPLRQPLRVVLDRRLRLPATARLLGEPGETLVFASETRGREPLETAGARIETLTGDAVLEQALRRLAALEVNDVLIEAGAILAGAFAVAGLVDRYVLYFAPRLLGGNTRRMLATPGWRRLADARELALVDQRMVGADLRIVAEPAAAA